MICEHYQCLEWKKSNNVTKKDSAVKRIPRVSSSKGQGTKRKRKNNKLDKKGEEKQIIVKRSSGRHEKFDTNRMTQTVSRSGVTFLMASSDKYNSEKMWP
jgi:hypothetical protein